VFKSLVESVIGGGKLGFNAVPVWAGEHPENSYALRDVTGVPVFTRREPKA